MAGYLDSLQETDCDSSLIDLDNRENLLEEYRPILEDQGYRYSPTGEGAGVHSLDTGDPQPRSVTSRGNRLRIGLKMDRKTYNEWFTGRDTLINLKLEDDVAEPSVPTGPSSNQIAIRGVKFTPYTICLEKILLSDRQVVMFLFDDVLHIICDVMDQLANLHDKSIVYSDIHVRNIYINDYMRAYLIESRRSRTESNVTKFIKESTADVKELCKVMGGLYNFYKRNKPQHSSNQEAEAALISLLRRGYKVGMRARDFLQEIGQILRAEVSNNPGPGQSSAFSNKEGSELTVSNTPGPEMACTVSNRQGPEIRSSVPSNTDPGLSRAVSFKQDPGLGSSVSSKPGPGLGSASSKKQGSELGSVAVPKIGTVRSCKQGPEMSSAVTNRQHPEVGAPVATQLGSSVSVPSGFLELRSGDMANQAAGGSLTDEERTHQELMSELEFAIFQSS